MEGVGKWRLAVRFGRDREGGPGCGSGVRNAPGRCGFLTYSSALLWPRFFSAPAAAAGRYLSASMATWAPMGTRTGMTPGVSGYVGGLATWQGLVRSCSRAFLMCAPEVLNMHGIRRPVGTGACAAPPSGGLSECVLMAVLGLSAGGLLMFAQRLFWDDVPVHAFHSLVSDTWILVGTLWRGCRRVFALMRVCFRALWRGGPGVWLGRSSGAVVGWQLPFCFG